MPPRKYPEAEDRNDPVVRDPDAERIDEDPDMRPIDRVATDTNANQKPRERGTEGGGARNESIEG